MLPLTAPPMELIALQSLPAQEHFNKPAVLQGQMEIVDGYLHLVLIVAVVHYTLIVLQLKAQRPNNVKLGVNHVFLMEFLVNKYLIVPLIQHNKLAQTKELMENAFGRHMVNQIKGLADCNYGQMLLLIITHIQDVNNFRLPHNVQQEKLVSYH